MSTPAPPPPGGKVWAQAVMPGLVEQMSTSVPPPPAPCGGAVAAPDGSGGGVHPGSAWPGAVLSTKMMPLHVWVQDPQVEPTLSWNWNERLALELEQAVFEPLVTQFRPAPEFGLMLKVVYLQLLV